MTVKVFEFNKNKKIEFTKAELEKLLNEVYSEGYNEANRKYWTWSPSYYTTSELTTNKTNSDWITVTCSEDSTSGSIDLK